MWNISSAIIQSVSSGLSLILCIYKHDFKGSLVSGAWFGCAISFLICAIEK